MFSAIGRAAIGRVSGGVSGVRVQQLIQRVPVSQSGRNALQSQIQGRAVTIRLSSKRLYSADAGADKPANKRASAAKSTTTKKATKAKKPVVKKKVLTEKQKEKKEADAAKAKLRAQKAKEKKVVEDAKAKIRELKTKVLTPPKRLPSTAWTIFHIEEAAANPSVPRAAAVKEAAAKYNAMDASTREHYNRLANENKASNDSAYESWVKSLTPNQILESNNSQQRLKRLGLIRAQKPLKIDDPRIPKRPLTSYNLFVKERYASGDFKGISPTEAVKILSQEFNGLSLSEKKRFQDDSAALSETYAKEMTSTFGTTRPSA